MATRSWHSRGLPTWRIWLISRLGRLRNIKNLAPGELPFAGGLVFLLAASMLWRAFPIPIALTGAGLVLILQEIADPSPLFLAVPWEALEFVLSRKARVNHFWLHRTQGLLRESENSLAKIDGCATRDGFFLIGATFNETQIQRASQSAWRATCQRPSAKEATTGCKTMQFLLALCLIAGGFTALSLFRGVNLGSGLLLCALCGAAGQLLAGPAEKLLGPWAGRVACSDEETWPSRLEVESLAIPRFLWFKRSLVFQVRRTPAQESNEG
jgi:hypothetical protein